MLGLPPPTIVLPAAVAAPTQAMLDAFTALDGNPMACELLPLDPGGEAALVPGYVVRPFATFHPVPSQARVLQTLQEPGARSVACAVGRAGRWACCVWGRPACLCSFSMCSGLNRVLACTGLHPVHQEAEAAPRAGGAARDRHPGSQACRAGAQRPEPCVPARGQAMHVLALMCPQLSAAAMCWQGRALLTRQGSAMLSGCLSKVVQVD